MPIQSLPKKPKKPGPVEGGTASPPGYCKTGGAAWQNLRGLVSTMAEFALAKCIGENKENNLGGPMPYHSSALTAAVLKKIIRGEVGIPEKTEIDKAFARDLEEAVASHGKGVQIEIPRFMFTLASGDQVCLDPDSGSGREDYVYWPRGKPDIHIMADGNHYEEYKIPLEDQPAKPSAETLRLLKAALIVHECRMAMDGDVFWPSVTKALDSLADCGMIEKEAAEYVKGFLAKLRCPPSYP